MSIEFNGKVIETSPMGYLENAEDWNEELRTRHVLNLDIMRLAESLQVDFAFPTQTLHIAGMPGQPQQLPQIPDRTHLREVVNSFGPDGERGSASTIQSLTATRVFSRAPTPKPTKVNKIKDYGLYLRGLSLSLGLRAYMMKNLQQEKFFSVKEEG